MKTLVVYASKYGCAAKCAKLLKEKLSSDVTLVKLGMNSSIDLEPYDCIVIGGSIYAGNIHPEVKKFCQNNMEAIFSKKLALFICGARQDMMVEQQNNAFGSRLLEHAITIQYFGYEYNLESMDFFAKLILRVVAKIKHSESRILTDNIQTLADTLA